MKLFAMIVLGVLSTQSASANVCADRSKVASAYSKLLKLTVEGEENQAILKEVNILLFDSLQFELPERKNWMEFSTYRAQNSGGYIQVCTHAQLQKLQMDTIERAKQKCKENGFDYCVDATATIEANKEFTSSEDIKRFPGLISGNGICIAKATIIGINKN